MSAPPPSLPPSGSPGPAHAIPIRNVPRAAVEALVARLQKDSTMTHKTGPDTVPPGPEAQAREVVEAMRARGPVSPEMERALVGAGRQHADFLERHGLSSEDWR